VFAEKDAYNDYIAFAECAQQNCNVPAQQQQECLLDNCGEEVSKCYNIAPYGESTCKEIFWCRDECTNGTCTEECYNNGSKEGRKEYDSFFECYKTAMDCIGETGKDLENCMRNECSSETTVCLGAEVVNDADEPEIHDADEVETEDVAIKDEEVADEDVEKEDTSIEPDLPQATDSDQKIAGTDKDAASDSGCSCSVISF